MNDGESVVLRVRCETPQETKSFGALCATVFEPGDFALLSGELGAGKTTFVQGVVAGLGGGEVTSPTFVLCHLYDTDPVVAHVDCWRFEKPSELADLALDELLDDGAIALIEWGELVESQLRGEHATVGFSVMADADSDVVDDNGAPITGRVIELRVPSRWRSRLDTVREGARQKRILDLDESARR